MAERKESEIQSFREHVDKRLDAMEKLLSLSLMSSLLGQVDEGYGKGDRSLTKEEPENMLHECSLVVEKREKFGEKEALYVRGKGKMGIRQIRDLLWR